VIIKLEDFIDDLRYLKITKILVLKFCNDDLTVLKIKLISDDPIRIEPPLILPEQNH